MDDLTQQIRDRLDGWAPPTGDGLPPQFAEVADPGIMTPGQVENWQRAWDELVGTAEQMALRVLPPGPKFYPGFEQMRDALLAVVEYATPGEPFPHDSRDYIEKEIDAEVEAVLAHLLGLIAEKLGIEVPDA